VPVAEVARVVVINLVLAVMVVLMKEMVVLVMLAKEALSTAESRW
jgi:hypothetical protein